MPIEYITQIPEEKTLKRILNVSVWTMIQNFVSLSTWFMFFLFSRTSGRTLTGLSPILSATCREYRLWSQWLLPPPAVRWSATSSGRANRIVYEGPIRQHIRIGYVFVLPILIFFCLFPDLILSIYTDMPDLRAASVPSLWVLCSAYLVLVPANVYFQSVSGTGNTRTALAMELCVLAIYVAYATYFILYLKMDVAFLGQRKACMVLSFCSSVINT